MSKRQVSAAEQLRRAIRQAERRGVTHYQIAKAAKMPQSQLSRIARGETCRTWRRRSAWRTCWDTD